MSITVWEIEPCPWPLKTIILTSGLFCGRFHETKAIVKNTVFDPNSQTLHPA